MKLNKEEKMIYQIIYMMQEMALRKGKNKQITRSAHAKSLGLVKAYFKVSENLPEDLAVGIFKKGKIYPALIRISNSSNKVKKDSKKDVRGFALKLLVADGKKQDFILVSTKHMPLRNIEAFHGILSLLNGVKPIRALVNVLRNTNFTQLMKLAVDLKHDTSPLDIKYYSMTPYKYGNQVVKYCIVPTSRYKSQKPSYLSERYLIENMKKHLQMYEATFDFMIQFQRAGMSVEDISQEWDEKISPFIKVGEIIIKPQKFDTPRRRMIGEQLSFSPGHTLLEHGPVGTLNKARILIYKRMAEFRRSY